jgi:hypothetical protein
VEKYFEKHQLGRPRRRREDNMKLVRRQTGCGEQRWMELGQDNAGFGISVKPSGFATTVLVKLITSLPLPLLHFRILSSALPPQTFSIILLVHMFNTLKPSGNYVHCLL